MALFPRPRIEGRPDPSLHLVPTRPGGPRIAVTEWPATHETSATASCVFLHAAGFHGRCWDQTIARLPSSMMCYAVDMRGHGRSDKVSPVDGVVPWPDTAMDVVHVLRALGVRGALGVGHSMGGWIIVRAALVDPSLFAGMVLPEPAIPKTHLYDAWRPPDPRNPFGMWAFVTKRFDEFSSPQHFFERLYGKGTYRDFRDECLADYCAYGLLLEGDLEDSPLSSSISGTDVGDVKRQRWKLACPPVIEAAAFNSACMVSDRARCRELDIPILVLRGEDYHADAGNVDGSSPADVNRSTADPDLWREFPQGIDVHLKDGMGHFIPMQNPGIVAENIVRLAMMVPRSLGETSKL